MFDAILVVVTTVFQLIAGLQVYSDGPVCMMVGQYKCAPIKLELRCMTPDLRVGWWDMHQDETCVQVLALVETSRAAE